MKLADATWPGVEAFNRDAVVLIPTGSLEQHGPHLPLFTDSLIVTAVAEAVERELSDRVVLTPTLWLGASGHHLKFAGSLSASFAAYMGLIDGVVRSLVPHGFHKFFVLNGHGGNSEPNGIVMRELKEAYPDFTFGHAGYYDYVPDEVAEVMTGPMKTLTHACEAETSLVLHLRPELVQIDRLADDGLIPNPAIRGLCHHFDEMTEQGSFGFATYADAAKGKRIFEAAVREITDQMKHLADGYVLTGIASNE